MSADQYSTKTPVMDPNCPNCGQRWPSSEWGVAEAFKTLKQATAGSSAAIGAMAFLCAHIKQLEQALANHGADLSAVDALARRFHEAYERLAPSFGYETRKETRAFDPESANGKLMIAVCAELPSQIDREHYPGLLSDDEIDEQERVANREAMLAAESRRDSAKADAEPSALSPLEAALASLLDEAMTELFEVTRDPDRQRSDTERVRNDIAERAARLVSADAERPDIDAPSDAVREYDAAMQSAAVPHEPLEIYDSKSWWRVGLARKHHEVMAPITAFAPDGHPDIRGQEVLRALVAAFNVLLECRARAGV